MSVSKKAEPGPRETTAERKARELREAAAWLAAHPDVPKGDKPPSSNELQAIREMTIAELSIFAAEYPQRATPARPVARLAAALAIDVRRLDERANERVRERSRTRKRLPKGLTHIGVVDEPGVEPRPPRPGETPTRRVLVSRRNVAPVELVPRERAVQLADLAGLFATDAEQTMILAIEVRAADAAQEVLRAAWIALLLRDISATRRAVLTKGRHASEARRAHAEELLVSLREQVAARYHSLIVVPEYVTAAVIRWAVERLSFAGGGGKTRKLSPRALATLLADPKALAAAMR